MFKIELMEDHNLMQDSTGECKGGDNFKIDIEKNPIYLLKLIN